MRTERCPFCARRCLSKKRKKKLGENWMVHSIEAYCSGLPRTAMVLFASNSMALLLLISNFVSAPSSSSTYDRSETRSSSSRKQAHEILMTVTIFFTTLTLNGLTLEFIPKNASSNKGGGRLRCVKCLTEFKCITKYEYNSVHLIAGIYHCLSNTVYIWQFLTEIVINIVISVLAK